MTTLQEDFENLTYLHPTIKKAFVRLLISELIDTKYLTSDTELTTNRNNFLNSFLPIYFDAIDQKFNSVAKTEVLFNEACKKSVEFESLLTKIIETTFDKLSNIKINWDYEQNIEPIERYIRIQDKIPFSIPTNISFLRRDIYHNSHSDKKFEGLQQEFRLLLSEKDNKRLLSIGISYCYGDIVLPKTYDIIFDTRDFTKYWEQKTIVKYAFNFGDYFHTDLWRGYHSHCLIEVIGDIPPIFNELPNNDGGKTLHRGIGLCTKYDWQYIKENNHD